MQILKSRKYEMFEFNDVNRGIGKRPMLVASMQQNGFFPHCAITVKKRGEKFIIEDGHHRYYYAKLLDIPLYYMVSETADMVSLRVDGKSEWSLSDSVSSYVRRGDGEYVTLVEFAEKHGYPLTAAIGLLRGKVTPTTADREAVRNGTFKVTGMDHAREVAVATDACRLAGIEFATRAPFVQAMAQVVMLEEFNVETFCSRVSTYPSVMQVMTTRAEYTSQIERVYNHKSRGGALPIVFQVDEAKKIRGANFGGKK